MTSIEDLKEFFLALPVSELKPLEVRNSGNRMSIIFYRRPPFQVELVIWMPGCVVPAHTHPNIDAIALAVSGELLLAIAGSEAEANDLVARARTWRAETLKSRPKRIGPNVWHGGKAGAAGATFWSFQKWTNGAEITAAGIDWHGPELVKPELAQCD